MLADYLSELGPHQLGAVFAPIGALAAYYHPFQGTMAIAAVRGIHQCRQLLEVGFALIVRGYGRQAERRASALRRAALQNPCRSRS